MLAILNFFAEKKKCWRQFFCVTKVKVKLQLKKALIIVTLEIFHEQPDSIYLISKPFYKIHEQGVYHLESHIKMLNYSKRLNSLETNLVLLCNNKPKIHILSY